ncbi:hypothetical protein CDAR_41751 [Caerostris darwini]|uniref:Histone H2A/H2B/H3 domain-containing protein n=1 Tax=Caerostris darwini TaxID=1538125 RepID=A0AAV4WAW2_9ARAC|nr:hypothetical protein CDAR_41751 [Caerostris darwini]
MTYGGAELKVKSKKKETYQEGVIKKNTNPFKTGVANLSSKCLQSLTLDREAKDTLALCVYRFGKEVASKAAETYGQKKDLQPLDLKHILSLYFENKAFNAAVNDANRCLALYENGLMDFKLKKRTMWTGGISKEQFADCFTSAIKRTFLEIDPLSQLHSMASKYLGFFLTEIAEHLADIAAEICQIKKTDMGDEELEQSVIRAFPRQLQEHALLKATSEISEYSKGNLKYVRRPKRTKPRSSVRRKGIKDVQAQKRKTKSRQPSAKRRKTSSSARQKRKRTESRKSSTTIHRRKTKSRQPSSKRRKTSAHERQKLQFGPFLTAVAPLLFRKIGISLAKDSVLYLSDLLEDVCHELASVSAQKASRSKELNAERVHAAVKEVFAKRMSEKAVSHAANTLLLCETNIRRKR